MAIEGWNENEWFCGIFCPCNLCHCQIKQYILDFSALFPNFLYSIIMNISP